MREEIQQDVVLRRHSSGWIARDEQARRAAQIRIDTRIAGKSSCERALKIRGLTSRVIVNVDGVVASFTTEGHRQGRVDHRAIS